MADLQFETAEYAGGAPTCVVCKSAVRGTHWMTGPNTVCASCHDLLEASLGERTGVAALALGTLYGAGAALAGTLVWFGIREATGVEFGLLGIGVGWAVAYAMKQAGPGGLPQQLIAVGLTYLSIVGSYAPTVFRDLAADATTTFEFVLSGLIAAGASLVFPVFAASSGDFMWFIILGIALWSAFSRSARPSIVWTGPFEAAPAA